MNSATGFAFFLSATTEPVSVSHGIIWAKVWPDWAKVQAQNIVLVGSTKPEIKRDYDGNVAQGSAKPSSPVRIRSSPPTVEFNRDKEIRTARLLVGKAKVHSILSTDLWKENPGVDPF
jgi:hypothetical protein